MKKLIALLLCLAAALSFAACAKQPAGNPPAKDVKVEGDFIVIDAAGLQLKYPAAWKDKVDVQVSDDEALFSSGDTKLFSVLFNRGGEGTFLGMVHGDSDIAVSVLTYDAQSEDPEIQKMQDDVNVILEHLIADYALETGEQAAVFGIETPLVTLRYPLKWQDQVTVDVSAEKVCFSNNGTPLFDLVFSECDGSLLGTYKETPIYVVGYDVETQDQLDMQEDVNVILYYLLQDSNFVLNQ